MYSDEARRAALEEATQATPLNAAPYVHGQIGVDKRPFAADPRLWLTGKLVGAATGYASLAEARAAARTLTQGSDKPAAAVVRHVSGVLQGRFFLVGVSCDFLSVRPSEPLHFESRDPRVRFIGNDVGCGGDGFTLVSLVDGDQEIPCDRRHQQMFFRLFDDVSKVGAAFERYHPTASTALDKVLAPVADAAHAIGQAVGEAIFGKPLGGI